LDLAEDQIGRGSPDERPESLPPFPNRAACYPQLTGKHRAWRDGCELRLQDNRASSGSALQKVRVPVRSRAIEWSLTALTKAGCPTSIHKKPPKLRSICIAACRFSGTGQCCALLQPVFHGMPYLCEARQVHRLNKAAISSEHSNSPKVCRTLRRGEHVYVDVRPTGVTANAVQDRRAFDLRDVQ